MPESVSNDRAIEVMAERLRKVTVQHPVVCAEGLVEALVSAGLQITDLTPEEAHAVATFLEMSDPPSHPPAAALLGRAYAKLHRFSGAS